MGIKAFIFDMDGTILHTLPDLVIAANEALGQMGFPRIGVLEGRRKTGWAGGMSRGNASGALEW